jgi:hypothetical protein
MAEATKPTEPAKRVALNPESKTDFSKTDDGIIITTTQLFRGNEQSQALLTQMITDIDNLENQKKELSNKQDTIRGFLDKINKKDDAKQS